MRDQRFDPHNANWAITLGEAISAYEVFANGQRIGGRGKMPPQPQAAMAAAQWFSLPGRLLDANNRVVIAVRFWRDPAHVALHGKFGSLWRGRPAFGLQATINVATEAAQLRHLLREMHQIVLGLGFATAAAYYMRLSRRRKDFSAAWWFGVVCACQAVSTLANKYLTARLLGEAFEPLMLTTFVSGALALAAMMQYLWHFVNLPPSRLERGIQCLVVCLALAGLGLLNSSQFFWFGGPVLVLGLLVAVHTVVRAWLRDHPDAGLIGAGFILMAAAAVFDIGAGQTLWPKLPIVRDALPFGFAMLLVSMALSLSNQLGRAYSDLDVRNLELNRVNQATRRFVPFEFLRLLNKTNVADIELGDQVQREMTVLFSDLRSFTDMSERMTPAETFAFVNQYFRYMVPVIRSNRGFVDKYVGDAIMALFEHKADDGVLAAIGTMQALRQFNADRGEQGLPPVQCGVGLHTGSVMVGTVGGNTRMDATVMSDAVNLASRIESATKLFGVGILITEATLQKLIEPKRFDTRRVGQVQVKGKTSTVALYEVFNADADAVRQGKLATLAKFAAALDAFERGELQEAADGFADCATAADDEVARLLADHCRSLQRFASRQSNWQPDGIMRLDRFASGH